MRARAAVLARRLAIGALERLAREVDRLAVALEPVREAMALRATGAGWEDELEVISGKAPEPSPRAEPIVAEASRAEPTEDLRPAEPPAAEPTASGPPELPLAMAQVAHLRARLEPQLALLREGGAWDQAEDPVEALRRLRVATRRLRAFVRLFAPMIGDKRAHRLGRRLRALTRGLGLRREWDALLAALRAEHARAEPLTAAALEHVIAWAEEQRVKATRKAHEAVAGEDLPALAKALDAALDRVCGRVLRLDEGLQAELRARLETERARALHGMPRPEHEDEVEALHEVRKRAKQLRYAVELLRPVLGERYAALRRPVKRVQRALGVHHDCSVLLEVVRARRDELLAHGLDVLAAALEAVAQRLQQRRRASFDESRHALPLLEQSV